MTKRSIGIGYKEAEVVDRLISEFLGGEPINIDNWREWYTFIRTIQTTLNILESEVEIWKQNYIKRQSK